MNAADRRRVTPTLGSVAVLLALLLIALWLGVGRGAHWHDAAAPPRLPPLGSNLPAPMVPSLERYGDVWQRPLFSPTRSPEPIAGSDGGASSDLELTGVILLPDLKMAIVHDKTRNVDYRVVEGQPSRSGPALIELHPRSAVVEAGGSRMTLQLIPGPSPAAGAAPASGQPQADDGAEQGGSAIVARQGDADSGRVAAPASGQAEDAQAAQLRARIQAARRGAEQGGGG